jgi:NAD(P)-dependent dehydrogenase (short-subunit alcohol dehydrogenase family)
MVRTLLEGGYRVAATSRDVGALRAAVDGTPDTFLPLAMELSNEASVRDALAQTVAAFGSVDVVVNNAGFGQFGAIEEVSDAEARRNYEVNVFGTLNVVRQALPQLRRQGAGHILNISSIGGYVGGYAGVGVYCSTKFAVAGLTEALAAELAPFGIRATVVYPGYFRTDFLQQGSMAQPRQRLDAYAEAHDVVDAHALKINHQQPGDPEKAAKAMIEAVEVSSPPVHLFLGSDAYALAEKKTVEMREALSAWQRVTTSTDF